MDYQSTVCGILKEHIIQLCSQKPLPDIDIELTNRFKSLMKLISVSVSPEKQSELMSYLSLALLGLKKHLIFRAQHHLNYQNSIIDYINWLKITMNQMPNDLLYKQINPILFDLSFLVNISSNENFCEHNEEGIFEFPTTLELSFEQTGDKQLLLMDDGLSISLVILNYDADIISNIFK